MGRPLNSASLAPVAGVRLEDVTNLYAYTSGRWLCHDKLERDSRFIEFDFDMLCKKVVELCPGALSIASFEKIEGGYNKVFIFTTDNGKRIVARLPTRIAGPPRYSEVATIACLKSKTTIPLPNIIDWSDDSSNAIGSEYIIMEHAAGVQLHQKWPEMSGVQRIGCVGSICQNLRQIAAIQFPAYGSLYFADLPIDPASKLPVASGFCIGPHCGSMYWDCNPVDPKYYDSIKPNRGPWTNLATYCSALIDIGLSRLPPTDSMAGKQTSYHGSIAEHIRLLEAGRDVINKLIMDPRIQNTATPTLLHPDLHKRNIFVLEEDPTTITSIIDWQSSVVEPTFMYASNLPDFAVPNSFLLPDDRPVDRNDELYHRAWVGSMTLFVPRLSAARVLDDNLLSPFRYCHRTWKDGTPPFMEELSQISKRWKILGLMDSCPYPLPPQEELLTHEKNLATFQSVLKLRRKLVALLDIAPDGWVPMDLWEATKVAYMELFDFWMEANENLEDPSEQAANQQELRDLWPFDIPASSHTSAAKPKE